MSSAERKVTHAVRVHQSGGPEALKIEKVPHHVDLAQLPHLETGAWWYRGAPVYPHRSPVTACVRSLTCCRRRPYAGLRR
jgi:hypothetical protein